MESNFLRSPRYRSKILVRFGWAITVLSIQSKRVRKSGFDRFDKNHTGLFLNNLKPLSYL